MDGTDETNRTKPYETVQLSENPRKEQAVNLLLLGMNDRQVAEAIGVRRATVCEWRHEPEFQSQLQSRQRELWEPYIGRLRSLLPRAIHTIEWQLHSSCDLKLALKLVELVGLGNACGLPEGSVPELEEPVAGSDKLRFHKLQMQELSDGYARSVGLPVNLQELERSIEARMARQARESTPEVNDDSEEAD